MRCGWVSSVESSLSDHASAVLLGGWGVFVLPRAVLSSESAALLSPLAKDGRSARPVILGPFPI